MLPKLGFSLEIEYEYPMDQVIGLLRDAGFSAVCPIWGHNLDTVSSRARAQGMIVQSLHAPPKGMAALWQPEDPAGLPLQKAMGDSLEACARFEIPVLVVHGWQGHGYVFPDAPLDFTFWDNFVQRAQALGVSIAFENLEGEEYLSALMARYQALPHIGFCWDSGHDRCYPHTQDFLENYGNRLMMTHLNDNFGVRGDTYTSKDDLHLLPFDGNTDWQYQMCRLARAIPQQILNFELKTRSHNIATYPNLSLAQYISQAAARAHQIAELYVKAP